MPVTYSLLGSADIWENQTDLTINQAGPISGTQYPVGGVLRNARIIAMAASVTWTVQPSPLEIHMAIDGNTYTFAKTDPVSTSNYECTIVPSDTILDDEWNYSPSRAFLIEGNSIEITAETTGGTVQNLLAYVKYALRVQ